MEEIWTDKDKKTLRRIMELINNPIVQNERLYESQEERESIERWFYEKCNGPDLYDRICKVITWYEHPEESPFYGIDFFPAIARQLHEVLCDVQNQMCSTQI